jgi:hypothetical protein
MADHPGGVQPLALSTPVQASAADDAPLVRRFRHYSITVVVVGLLAAGLVSWWLPPTTHTELVWTGLLLTLGFLVAEQLAINVDVRSGVSWSISFTEIPLAIGLFVAPFELVLLAHVIAGLSTLLARGVHDRALYNAGVLVIEITTAFAVFHAFQLALVDVGPPWAGVFVGAFAAPVASTLLGLVTVFVLGRRIRLSAGVLLVGRTLVLGMVNAAVGVVGYVVSVHTQAGWGLVVLALGGFGALYLAYSGLLREQRDLEALSQVSLIVARSGQLAAARPATGLEDNSASVASDEWQAIAERIKDQLGAARVVLHVRFDPQAPMHTTVAGSDLPQDAHGVEVAGSKSDPLLRLPGSHVRHFRRIDAMPEIRQSLIRPGAA